MSDGGTRYRPQSAIQHLLFNHGLLIILHYQSRPSQFLSPFSFLLSSRVSLLAIHASS
jgi:hypothetical protein